MQGCRHIVACEDCQTSLVLENITDSKTMTQSNIQYGVTYLFHPRATPNSSCCCFGLWLQHRPETAGKEALVLLLSTIR